MKKDYLLGVLFFGSLWGIVEAGLGGFFYKIDFPHTSIVLTACAFLILSIAYTYFPKKYTALFIGTIAMLYKFLNTPFYACHLLAIFLLGLAYTIVFDLIKLKNKSIAGMLATYLGYLFFASSITYIFRYQYWINSGWPKIIEYVGIKGTLAAGFNFFVVPAGCFFGEFIKQKLVNPFSFKSRIAALSISLITLTFWLLGKIIT